MAESLIEMRNLWKTYSMGDLEVEALRGVSLEVPRGEFVAIVGASGSGKSTLLAILGCLDRPTRGLYRLGGRDVSVLSSDDLATIRSHEIGFVFQNFHLLSRTTAIENVELPLFYTEMPHAEQRRRAREALARVGLADRENHYPNQLSGGQQQRVAVARALVNDPPLLLADEPTGNLDSATGFEILEIFRRLNRERGITIALVTHEADIAAFAQRVVTFRDGQIVSDLSPPPSAAPDPGTSSIAP